MRVASGGDEWVPAAFEAGLVSVVMPTYNRADVVEATLGSVAAQSYRPIEIVIVDDGSTDDTVAVVQAWNSRHACADLRLQLHAQENAGAPRARNRGAQEARGEFIQFLDSDDLLLPMKIARSVEVLQDPAIPFVSCDYARFSGEPANIVHRSRLAERSAAPASQLMDNKLHTISAVYRRSLLNRVGPWHEPLSVWQDSEFCLRVLLVDPDGVWIPECLALVRDSPGSIMNQSLVRGWEGRLEALRRMESVAATYGVLDVDFRDAAGRRLATVARRLAQLGDWDASRTVHEEAMARMTMRHRWTHGLHRVALRTLGPRIMERLGLM